MCVSLITFSHTGLSAGSAGLYRGRERGELEPFPTVGQAMDPFDGLSKGELRYLNRGARLGTRLQLYSQR